MMKISLVLNGMNIGGKNEYYVLYGIVEFAMDLPLTAHADFFSVLIRKSCDYLNV